MSKSKRIMLSLKDILEKEYPNFEVNYGYTHKNMNPRLSVYKRKRAFNHPIFTIRRTPKEYIILIKDKDFEKYIDELKELIRGNENG